MQRPIKFRAWCPPVSDGEITLTGHMDYELEHQKLIAVRTETRAIPAQFGFEHIQHGLYFINKDLEAYGDRLMQFTGLKDKNGKEIYEGDVVKRWDDIFEVVWKKTGWALKWLTTTGTKSLHTPNHRDWAIVEVIGNIYENPELLSTHN